MNLNRILDRLENLLRLASCRVIAAGQGLYFLATGVWPVAHISSFVTVTGPKTDIWLVRTVGLLLAVIGGVLLSAAARKKVSVELVILGIGAAAALCISEAFYVLHHQISAIYLVDAFLEICFIFAWALCARREPCLVNPEAEPSGPAPEDK